MSVSKRLGVVGDLAAAAKVLTSSGLVSPVRPDRLLGMALSIGRWGFSPAAAYAAGAARDPDRIAVIDEREAVSYAEIDRRSTAVAHALADRGVHVGDAVALLARNSAAFIVAQAAISKLGADTIYVASIDGTPRRFGSGSLPGLRYPWFKWFDPSRSVPLPRPSSTAIYLLSELAGQSVAGDLVACLGPPSTSGVLALAADEARRRCADPLLASAAIDVTFDGLARIDALRAPQTVEAGQALDASLVWQPLVTHPEAHQVSLQLDDPAADDGTLWGNGTLELYPAREWEPGEPVLSRVKLHLDSTPATLRVADTSVRRANGDGIAFTAAGGQIAGGAL